MRRFGLHGVVALAGLVACSRFGTEDETKDKVEPVDGSTSSSSSSSSGAVGPAREAGAPTPTRFCSQHEGAKFCADFEDGESPPGATPPAGANGFSASIEVANGRKALHLIGKNVPDKGSWGLAQGAFRVPLEVGSFTSAKIELEVLCETTEVTFVRLTGFDYVPKAGPLHLTIDTGIPNVFEFGGQTAPRRNGVWTHISMDVTNDDQNLTGTVRTPDGDIEAAKISVKEPGDLLFGFGAWDISEDKTKTLSVWIDDVVLTTK